MIGTHDSFTYLNPKKRVFNILSFLWRTQTKNIQEQRALGVKYFDIRVRYYKGKWILCHGLVDFDTIPFSTLEDIMKFFNKSEYLRVILERVSSNDDIFKFKHDILVLKEKYKNIVFSCIKKDWNIVINNDLHIIDYTYTPFLSNLSLWDNIKRMNFFSTIKKWAKKHNPTITEGIVEDKNTVHFLDYV